MKSNLLILLSCAFALQVQAGSTTWKSTPTSSDWNTAGNWTPATVPNGAADDATFATANTTAIVQYHRPREQYALDRGQLRRPQQHCGDADRWHLRQSAGWFHHHHREQSFPSQLQRRRRK